MKDETKRMSLSASYQLDDTYDSTRFIKMRLKVCHTGRNLNRSVFTLDGFEKAQPSITNVPILANVLYDEEGKPKFGGHDMTIELDSNDNPRMIYQETPIGLIPETCNYSLEEEDGRFYVMVDGYVWRDYANYAEDIITEKGAVPLSMEIDILDYSCFENTDDFLIKDYRYRGVTFLGDDLIPAMQGAKATAYSFENSAFFEKMQNALTEELNKSFENTQSEEAKKMENEKTVEQTSEGQFNEKVVETSEEPTAEMTKETREPEKDFALLSSIVSEVCKGLGSYTMDFEGIEIQKYYFEDIDTDKQTVYVYSMADSQVYAAPYMVENDTVSLVPNFRRQVLTYRDFVEGQDTLNDYSVDTPALQVEKFNEMKSSLEAAEAQVKELTEYKEKAEAAKKEAEVNATLEQFSDLAGVEEFEALKTKALEYSAEDLEKECFAIRGKQHTPKKTEKINYSHSDATGVKFPVLQSGNESSQSRIGDMIKHYSKKG